MTKHPYYKAEYKLHNFKKVLFSDLADVPVELDGHLEQHLVLVDAALEALMHLCMVSGRLGEILNFEYLIRVEAFLFK